MPILTLNDVNLYYEVHGEGPPLLLIAGLSSDSQSWATVVDDLSKSFRVITPDNRGTGRTEPGDVEISIGHMADDCMALVEALGMPTVNVVGHSMGGFVALDCAIRYPERIAKLVLEATSSVDSDRNDALFADWAAYLEAGMEPTLWYRNVLYWIFTRRFFEDAETFDEAVRLSVEYPYRQSPSAYAKQARALAEYDCAESLPAVKARTLILCGEEDMLFPPEETREALAAIPDATVAMVPKAAHSIHFENPAGFLTPVLEFLSDD